MANRALRPQPNNLSYAIESESMPEQPSSTGKKPQKTRKPASASITKNHLPAIEPKTLPSLQSRLPEVPNYTPMKEFYPLHSAYNRLPAVLHGLKGIPASAIFKYYFTDSLFEIMAINTNAYAKAKQEAALLPGRPWVEVTAQNLKQWVGICIYMGLFLAPAVEDYWKHDGLHPTHSITKYMSLTRFEQIKRYLHISPLDIPTHTPSGRRLWHGKVDPLLNQLRRASQALRVPSSNVSIDEAMIRCTGRSLDTYKMPSKPIERGFKFHCLADHGYIWDFHPTSNQAGPDPVPTIEGLTPTGEVVYYLVDKLPKRKTWHVYLDNFYTSLPLLVILKDRLGVGACGTAKPGSCDFPSALAIAKKDVSKVAYHFCAGLVILAVGILLWFDNAPVTMMTTIHTLRGEDAEILKNCNRPGKKSKNHKRAMEEFGDNHTKEIKIPVAINDYNHHMGGVDIADQLRSYYDTQLTTFRTWFPIFFWVLDTALINAFLVFKDLDSVEVTHKGFRLQVAWDLILEGEQEEEVEKQAGKRKATIIDTTKSLVKKLKYVSKTTTLPPCRGDGSHLPEASKGSEEECWLCRYKLKEATKAGAGSGGRGYKTHWKCSTCDLPLCLNTSRNCFTEFHRM